MREVTRVLRSLSKYYEDLARPLPEVGLHVHSIPVSHLRLRIYIAPATILFAHLF